nr:TonB-dependent receptor [Parabacteroides goldsteinii]
MNKKFLSWVFYDKTQRCKHFFRIMKLTTVCSLALAFSLHAGNTNSQTVKVTVKQNNVELENILNDIEKQTDYLFVYDQYVNMNHKVSINSKNRPLEEVLNHLFEGMGVKYTVDGTYIVLSPGNIGKEVVQQSRVVTGVVKDMAGEPIIGANVSIKGTASGTTTDVDGNFSINAESGTVLLISYIGYNSQEIKIASKRQLTIVLTENTQDLEEVVVIGYGVQKKKLSTGATVQVKGDELSKMNTVSPLTAMQSKTPGMQITQNSGLPGSDFKINIRGLGTMGNSSPLVIIDGIIGGDLNSLNAADIESLDVLKDAASAAIYGARAANGVILVTTKSGKEGKTTISYDGYVGIQNPGKSLDVLDAYQYLDYLNEATDNSGLTRLDFESTIPRYNDLRSGVWGGTDWSDEFANKNAFTQNHAFNMTSGNANSTMSLGLTYTTQEAVIGNPNPMNYERYTGRLNSDHVVYKANGRDIIKIGERLLYSAVNKKNTGMNIGDMYGNDLRMVNLMLPVMAVYDENGDFTMPIPLDSNTGNQIASNYYRSHNSNSTRSLNANIYAEISPIKNLRLKTSFNLYTSDYSFRGYLPVYEVSMTVYNPEAKVSQEKKNTLGYQWENTIAYDWMLKEKHTFNFILGQSIEKSGLGDNLAGSNINPIYDGFDFSYLSNCKSLVVGKTSLSGLPNSRGQLASFFGRINYNYDEKYMLTVVMRADGSSNFARGNRWGYFPSVSAGWVLTNENFMENTRSWMDFLKVRASWGQNGNQAINNFQYLASYALGGYKDYTFGIDKTKWETGAYANIMPNKDITWETSEQINIGADARFLGSRLSVTADWYRKNTKDWLVQAPILSSFGAGAPYINGGAIRNQGFELSAGWNDQVGDFYYGANVNMSFNKNKITRIDNSEGIIRGWNEVFVAGGTEIYRAEVGKPIGYFYGYKTLGVFQNQEQIDNYKGAKLPGVVPGDVIYADVNNDGIIDVSDRTDIGDPNPDMTMGLSVNLGYKGFDLGITANGVFGNQIATCLRTPGKPYGNLASEYWENRWHGEGTSNRFPRITYELSNSWLNYSDIYIEDGNYLRIQNITVGYDFKRLFPSMPLQQARLYVTGQNLFTITGYYGADPEIGFANESWAKGVDVGFYSAPKSVLFGVNLKF